MPELYYIITEYYLSLENQDEAVKYFDKVLQSRGLTGYADRQGASAHVRESDSREEKRTYL
ncbi:MAG: hypothetical protein ACLTZT_17025 [Butyricimonas faecalis]